MLFVIQPRDREGALPARLAHYEADKAFLADTSPFGIGIVVSGPLTADDGDTVIGSPFLAEAPDPASVERFHAADPFHSAGPWDTLAITRFVRRQS